MSKQSEPSVYTYWAGLPVQATARHEQLPLEREFSGLAAEPQSAGSGKLLSAAVHNFCTLCGSASSFRTLKRLSLFLLDLQGPSSETSCHSRSCSEEAHWRNSTGTCWAAQEVRPSTFKAMKTDNACLFYGVDQLILNTFGL